MEKNNIGHMAKVGYEMYLAMLERAIKYEKEGLDKNKANLFDENEVKIDLQVSAYISDSYIKDPIQKIVMYQKISEIQTNEDSLDVIDELLDRFGSLPKETENLIKIVEIRNLAKQLGITKIFQYGNILKLTPDNLTINLTNKANNDILVHVQQELKKLIEEKG